MSKKRNKTNTIHPHGAPSPVPRARHRPARPHTQTRRHVRLRAREHAHRHRQGVHRPRIRPEARLSRRKGTTRPRFDSISTHAREIRDTIRCARGRLIRARATDERLDRLAIGREARRDRSRGLVRGFGRQHGTRDVERARDGRRDRIGRSERSFFFARFIARSSRMNGRRRRVKMVSVGVMRAVDVPKRAREVFFMCGTRARRVVVGSD